jgi:hypothetical protein
VPGAPNFTDRFKINKPTAGTRQVMSLEIRVRLTAFRNQIEPVITRSVIKGSRL